MLYTWCTHHIPFYFIVIIRFVEGCNLWSSCYGCLRHPVPFCLVGPKSYQVPRALAPSLCVLPECEQRSFTPYETLDKITDLYILFFTFLNRKWEDKRLSESFNLLLVLDHYEDLTFESLLHLRKRNCGSISTNEEMLFSLIFCAYSDSLYTSKRYWIPEDYWKRT